MKSKALLTIKAVAALCVCAAFPALQASMIFQADFNGAGTGTGGANDLVTFGGTGSTFQYSTALVNVKTSNPTMGQGGYMNVDIGAPAGGSAGGANFTPTTSGNSWAGMQTIGGGSTAVNGAADLFVRFNSIPDISNVGSAFRPIDMGANTGQTGEEGKLGLWLQNQGTNTVRLMINGGTAGSFLTGGTYTNRSDYALIDATFAFTLATVSHLGFTFSTDAGTGVTTMKLFASAGALAIDTTSGTSLIGSTTFKIDGTRATVGFSSGAFDLSGGWMGPAPRNVDYDAFRLYNAAPATFAAIPEPGTVGLLGLGLLGLAMISRRKSSAKQN